MAVRNGLSCDFYDFSRQGVETVFLKSYLNILGL